MTNPTSNFGWQMPEPTDLVTNLPADFEVFGQAVDTDFADLLGGTTGQVLKKNTNADLDFVWGADSAGMTNPMTTTGDIIYSSPGSTPVRLGIGSAAQVLTVASGVPSWASPAGGGKLLQVVYGSTATTVTISSNVSYRDTGLSATITPTLNTSKVLILTNTAIQWTRPASDGGLVVRFLRGSTSIFEPAPSLTTEFLYFVGTTNGLLQMQAGLQYLDSPATTSATTYKQQFNNTYGTSQATAQSNGITSTMILMEIGA